MSIRQAVVERGWTARSDALTRQVGLTSTSVRRRSFAVLGTVWAFAGLYEWHFLFRGWFPHDEGALAESARRILAGELPHRDFADVYTGGLSYLHALAFLAFGEELTSMRIVLFAFFLAWIPALYFVARHFASGPVAGACVAACIAWSVPNYSASMGSWYNLFFATFVVAFVLRYFDDRRARWLIGAGVACGVSVTLKVTGIYVVIAVLLTLLFDAQLRSTHDASARRSKEFAFVVACATATVVFLVVLVHRRLGIAEAVNFILPGSGIVMFLVWSEKVLPRFGAGLRLRSVLRPFSWFALGLTVPILAFISPYIASNSLGSLIEGVIVAPSARLEFAAMKPPSIVSLPVSVLALIAFLGIGYGLSRARFAGRAAVMGLLATAFVLTATPYGYRITWFSVRDASLLLVPVGIAFLVTAIRSGLSNSTENVRTFALLAVFAFATLIQFPFSASLYFFYVVPLVFLAMLALAAHWRDGSLPVLHPFAVAGAFLFLAAFGIARLNEEFVGGRASIGEGAPLGLARSGPLRVSPADARLYRRVVARIQAVRASRYIYAGPDAPEVYFLSNRRNPTRAEFEFFERGSTQGRELLQVLNRYGVSLVALNLRPQFSPPLDSRVLAALSSRYPHHERIGRFELRWRT